MIQAQLLPFQANKVFKDSFDDFDIYLLSARQDNYFFVLVKEDKKTLILDPSDADFTIEFIEKNKLQLESLLLTHHHYDHTDQIDRIYQNFSPQIFCSKKEIQRDIFSSPAQTVKEGDLLYFGDSCLKVLETPGHTQSHLSFFIEKNRILFCGDLLFSLGCGRIFEKTPNIYESFFNSLDKVKKLSGPESQDFKIYCSHEYTLANLDFCLQNKLTADPEALSQALKEQLSTLSMERSVPSTFIFEQKFNPFLNCKNSNDFKRLRDLKDSF